MYNEVAYLQLDHNVSTSDLFSYMFFMATNVSCQAVFNHNVTFHLCPNMLIQLPSTINSLRKLMAVFTMFKHGTLIAIVAISTCFIFRTVKPMNEQNRKFKNTNAEM